MRQKTGMADQQQVRREMTELHGKDRELAEQRLAQLRMTHSDLDAAIEALIEKGTFDALQLQRMKRRKLQVKDDISRITAMLSPDIIA